MVVVITITKNRKNPKMQIMATNKKKNEIANNLARKVKSYILNQPALDDLSDEQLNKLFMKRAENDLYSELDRKFKLAKLDEQDLAKRWLGGFTGETKRSFERNLSYFLDYLTDRNKTLIDLDFKIAKDFIKHVNNKPVKDNTKLQHISAVSSFCNDLVQDNTIKVNPFLKLKKPKKQPVIKLENDIPTEQDLKDYIAYFEKKGTTTGKGSVKAQEGSHRAILCLNVLMLTGIRVGSLGSLTFDLSGRYKADSKTGQITGTFSSALLKILKKENKQPFKGYTGFSMAFHRAGKDLGKSFSPHSIRHHFAVKLYKKTKDIMKVKKALSHKTLLATQTYLSSLGFEV